MTSSCQRRILCLSFLLSISCLAPLTCATPVAEVIAETLKVEEPKFVVISEDVIPDVENTTQKVIRVNPLDIPDVRDDPTGSNDSSLYNIQSLLPAHQRHYVNSNRMRKRPRPAKEDVAAGDSPILRNFPEPKFQKPKPKEKKKHLHFLYNQEALDGHLVGRNMRVHVAPGAYPIYYAVSKSNGRFGKYPLKGFRSQEEFVKYLLKSKLASVDLTQKLER